MTTIELMNKDEYKKIIELINKYDFSEIIDMSWGYKPLISGEEMYREIFESHPPLSPLHRVYRTWGKYARIPGAIPMTVQEKIKADGYVCGKINIKDREHCCTGVFCKRQKCILHEYGWGKCFMHAGTRYELLQQCGYWDYIESIHSEDYDVCKEIYKYILDAIKERMKPLYAGRCLYPQLDKGWGWEDSKARREKLRNTITNLNLTLHETANILKSDCFNGWGYHYLSIYRDSIILDDIPKAVEDFKERQHQRRMDVSRVAMRTGLPSDLVPILCAFAVPGSKQYPYMRM